MRWCARCVLPDTRPSLKLDAEGVCSACRAFERRAAVDWDARAADLERLVRWARGRSAGYDCVVPVSGGKDSTWQVVSCVERGLRPLAVSWRPPGRTEVGRANLDNLGTLGVDHVDYRIDPEVERRFTLAALERRGDPAIPMHMAIFAIPTRLAVALGIPLVVWGENSAEEYGTTGGAGVGARLDSAWLARFGVTGGTTWRDWEGVAGLTARDLTAYRGPTPEEAEAAGTTCVFLGHLLPWDPEHTRRVAAAHGFRAEAGGARTGVWDFADIDDAHIAVHHWLKWHKFGFTRTFDNLSVEIRHGRISRDDAVASIRDRGDETPWDDIGRLAGFLGITPERLVAVADGFRDPSVWSRRDGRWVIDGFLVPDREWT